MKKGSYLLPLLILYGCMAAIASPSSQPYHSQQSGIAVWNNALYIHAADTLVAHGNLYLFNADVAGHGTLRLSDTASRRIVAHHSSLPHLIIDNTDTVALQGDLHIRCGLTLAQGVFDTRAANLTLSDSAFVHILPGSHWLQDDDVTAHWLPILPLLPPTARQALPVADIFPSTYTGLAAPPPRQPSEAFFFCNPWLPKIWPSIPCPPPKGNSESLVAA